MSALLALPALHPLLIPFIGVPSHLLWWVRYLARVRFRHYVAASAVGMVPGTFMYVYTGYAAGQVAAGTAGAAPGGPGYYALLGVGLLATIAVTVLVTRTARRALRRSTERSTDVNGDEK